MGNDGKHEHWHRLLLPLGISLVVNLILCGALAHLSAAPPAPQAGIEVKLDGVTPPPPPPLPQPLLKRLFTPPKMQRTDPPSVKPDAPQPEPKPTLFSKITQIFRREDPPAPKVEEPQPVPVEPEKVAANPPEPERPTPEPVNPAPPIPGPEPVKTVEPPVTPPPGPTTTGSGSEPGGNHHVAVEPPGQGSGTDGGKGPGTDSGKGPGGDGHGTQVAIGAGAGPGGGDNHDGNPGGGTKNTGPGASSGTGTGSGTLGSGPDKDGGKDPGTGKNPGTSSGSGDGTTGDSGSHGPSRGARVVKQSRPAYPTSARDDGIEGTVQLTVSLDAAGKVTGTKLLKTSGDRRLDRAAESEVRKWTFEAKMEDGTAVESTIKVNVVFKLE